MTRDEILKMDGQELCRWLDNRNVLMRVGEDLYKTYHGDYIICACAFAARDYCVSHNLQEVWFDEVIDIAGAPYEFAQPIDWLCAAAIVIVENEKGAINGKH